MPEHADQLRALSGLKNTNAKRRVFFMNGRPTQKTTPQITKKQFAQTVCPNNFGTVCTNCPPFPFKKCRKQTKEFAQTVVQTAFIWVGGFWGGLPSLDF